MRPLCSSLPGALPAEILPSCCAEPVCSLTQPSELPENNNSVVSDETGEPKLPPGGFVAGVVVCSVEGTAAQARQLIQECCALNPPTCSSNSYS